MLLILTKMRIEDENLMIGKEMKMGCLILSKIRYRHALILTKMRIGDENMMIGKVMKMGCMILSKMRIGML